MKKRGFGMGKWNGVGGKIEADETPEEAAIRETEEEIGVRVAKVQRVATLDFHFTRDDQENIRCHTFVVEEWDGDPLETEEMRPKWFSRVAIPYEDMWEDDKHWLPLVLAGKRLKASFTFAGDDQIEKLQEVTIEEV